MISKMEFFCGNRLVWTFIEQDRTRTVPRVGDRIRRDGKSYVVEEVWHDLDSTADRVQFECGYMGEVDYNSGVRTDLDRTAAGVLGCLLPGERTEERRAFSK